MRHQSTGRRHRNRGNGGRRGGPPRMQVFDSNGPDVRIRGTAHQVHEKYLTLAKDAAAAGDRILAESYMQHAEHYQRVINRWESDSSTYGGDHYERAPEAQAGDDLALPASILGANAKAENAPRTRVAEPAAAE